MSEPTSKRRTRTRSTAVPHLAAWRAHAGLGLVELANAAHVARSTITRAELNNEPLAYGTIAKLAAALGTSPTQLLAGPPLSTVAMGATRGVDLSSQRQTALVEQLREQTAHAATLAAALDPAHVASLLAAGASIEAAQQTWVRLRVARAAATGQLDE